MSLSLNIQHRKCHSSKDPIGRFGGGWNYALGLRLSPNILLVDLLITSFVISWKRPCACSAGDICSCAYDCECRERLPHEFSENEGWIVR